MEGNSNIVDPSCFCQEVSVIVILACGWRKYMKVCRTSVCIDTLALQSSCVSPYSQTTRTLTADMQLFSSQVVGQLRTLSPWLLQLLPSFPPFSSLVQVESTPTRLNILPDSQVRLSSYQLLPILLIQIPISFAIFKSLLIIPLIKSVHGTPLKSGCYLDSLMSVMPVGYPILISLSFHFAFQSQHTQ